MGAADPHGGGGTAHGDGVAAGASRGRCDLRVSSEAPQSKVIDELTPAPGEPVFDKLGMSAFVGTPLEVVLRDRCITTTILVGAVLEIGIEPTARHAADLGFLPVVVEDACGVVDPAAGERSVASLDYSLLCYRATAAEVAAALRR
ncbi:cysteine hydrolase [Rhodococcus opacus]|nr:cysteine hydrolase [Rhodococcus opacus]